MIRSQVLLTAKLSEKITRIAETKKVSKSHAVRLLLEKAFSLERSERIKRTGRHDYIYPLEKYSGKNNRINGFKELYTVGANITTVYVIDHKVFLYYKRTKQIPDILKKELIITGTELKKISVSNKLVLRRAYFVPGLENPPGPRYVGISPKDLPVMLEELYKFALENNYDIKEGYEIAAFFYPFADPEPLDLEGNNTQSLPYGGYAYPINTNGTRVEILAVWGNNEGVQSFDSLDRYVVDAERKIILTKDIPQKSIMFATTNKSQSEKMNIPVDKQFEQVLNDEEILETARIVFDLNQKVGSRRIEFSYDGVGALEYNESAPYVVKRNIKSSINKKARVLKITSQKDISRIVLKREFINENFLYIDKSMIENRSYDVLNAIAGLPLKFTVLYPGLSATAHAMRVLTDFGHNAIAVGNRVFNEGDEVHIKTNNNGILEVRKLNDTKYAKYILNLHDAKLYNSNDVGTKAYNLSLLKMKGFNVPHGVVLTSNFFDTVLKDSGVSIKTIIKRSDKIMIDKDLWLNILDFGFFRKDVKYSVRSSSTVEDQKVHSFAGQFKTFLNVDYSDLKNKVLDVIKSSSNETVIKYFKALNKKFNLKMAVIVQEMVDAAISGVIFGKDIQTMNQNNIVIDMVTGLGEGVVDGTAKSTRIVYSKTEGRIIQAPNIELVKITKAEINALIEMAVAIERSMGSPQDIEWSIDKKGVINILQSRDV